MLPDPGLYLALALLGGWMGIDGTGCGQFMVSRPLVASVLAGLAVGNPGAGLAAGVVLEAFHLTVLPVGAARYPEGGPPAVAAGALFAGAPPSASVLLTVVVFFLLWERLGGETVRLQRQANDRLFSLRARPPRRPAELERWHVAAIGLDFLRAALLTAVGMLVLAALLQLSRMAWGLGDRVPQVVLGAVIAMLLAGSLRLFGGRTRLFLVGAAGGLLLLLARQ